MGIKDKVMLNRAFKVLHIDVTIESKVNFFTDKRMNPSEILN